MRDAAPEAAPTWAKAIVMIFDNLEGKPPAGGLGPKQTADVYAKTPSIPPKASRETLTWPRQRRWIPFPWW